VVGGGNSAGQAVVYLAAKVAKLWLIVRGPGLEASMSSYLIERIAARPNVEFGHGLASFGGSLLARRPWRDNHSVEPSAYTHPAPPRGITKSKVVRRG
jgi:hypothetical protein